MIIGGNKYDYFYGYVAMRRQVLDLNLLGIPHIDMVVITIDLTSISSMTNGDPHELKINIYKDNLG